MEVKWLRTIDGADTFTRVTIGEGVVWASVN